MTNEEKARLLKDYKDNYLKDVTKCVETLIEMGDLKRDYAEILKMETGLIRFDDAVERYVESDDYEVLSALLTFLTREEVVDIGAFEERVEKGDVGKVVDNMLAILNSEIREPAQDSSEEESNDYEPFDPEEFLKRIESEDFDPANMTEEDKRKLALLRFYEDDWGGEGVTATCTPRE